MQQKFYETCNGLEKVREEVKKLEDLLQNVIPKELKTATDFGDLSENAEYHEAKRKQSDALSKLSEFKHFLNNAVMVERQKSYDKVIFGCYIKVIENQKKKLFRIVGKHESDASKGFLYYGSPLARAFMNKKVCDCFEFETPSKKINEYEILEIGYYEDC